jgi:hypothetical protein
VLNLNNTLAQKVEIQLINGTLAYESDTYGRWGLRQVQVSGWNSGQDGCAQGYVCRVGTETSPGNCSMPTISEECQPSIGCSPGHICKQMVESGSYSCKVGRKSQ